MENELRALLHALKTEYNALEPDSDRALALDRQVRRLDAYLWSEVHNTHLAHARLVAARHDPLWTPRF